MKPKQPRPQGHTSPQPEVILDDFGYPVEAAIAADATKLAERNAYRDQNAAVAAWVEATGFDNTVGSGAYTAFKEANPDWVSKYGYYEPGFGGKFIPTFPR